jgi:C6 transcription factor Pro1
LACPSDDDLDAKAEQDSLWLHYVAIYALCQWLEMGQNDHQILDVTLGFLYSQTLVGSAAHGHLDMAWHQHFGAAVSQAQAMKLPQLVLDPDTLAAQIP